MAQILIRDLDPAIVARLKAQAKEHGRSLESEVRLILAAAVEQMDWKAAWAGLDALRSQFGDRVFSDSTALIREDRDR